jgi:hypothetical protein
MDLPALYFPGYYKIVAALREPTHLQGNPIEKLLPEEYLHLEHLAMLNGINLAGFPRVPFPLYQQKMVDCLNGLQPERLLFVLPGRGNAMWKIWEICHHTEISAFDTNPDRLAFWQHLERHGLKRLHGLAARQPWEIPNPALPYDAIAWQIQDGYNPENTKRVLRSCTQLTSKFVILTVPKNLPARKEVIEFTLRECGILSCKWETFPNHLLAIARK